MATARKSKEFKKRSKAAKMGWKTRRWNQGRAALSKFLDEHPRKAVPEELKQYDSVWFRFSRMYYKDLIKRSEELPLWKMLSSGRR